jgi:putative transcriptional regulator
MKAIRPVGSRKRAPASHYVLTVVFGVIITAGLSMIIGFTNSDSFWLAFAVTAVCTAYPVFAVGLKVFSSGHTVTTDAFGEEGVELRWMERAGAGAFLGVLVAAMIGAAALLITRFEIEAGGASRPGRSGSCGCRRALRTCQAPGVLVENIMAARRLERGWSQAELAARLGVSRQTVISIERGRFDPSLPRAFHIARAFGCTIETIFMPTEAPDRR